MNFLNKIIILGVTLVLSALVLNSKAYAANGDYGLSCTNEAYGTQHGGIYISYKSSGEVLVQLLMVFILV